MNVNIKETVVHIEDGLHALKDGRVNPTYQTVQVISLVLFGFLLRIKSCNELNNMIKVNDNIKITSASIDLLIQSMAEYCSANSVSWNRNEEITRNNENVLQLISEYYSTN